MAIAVASTSNAGFGASPRTVTKPSGLAVGDLLVAVIACSGPTINLPSNWNSRVSDPHTNGNLGLAIFDKVADASDVAASDFSFTHGVQASVLLMRVTGAPQMSSPYDVSASAEEDTAGGSVAITPITPQQNNSLLVLAKGHTSTSDGTSSTFSGYAINGTNPTWSEQIDLSADTGSRRTSYGVATAIMTTAAEIDTITIDESGVEACVSAIVVYRPMVSAAVTVSHLSPNTAFHAFTVQAGTTMTIAPLSVNTSAHNASASAQSRRWTNLDKSSTITPTNLDKS